METARSLLQDIHSLERRLQDLITQRELLGINHAEVERQQEEIQKELISKKKSLRQLTEPDSKTQKKQPAFLSGGVSLQILEEIAGMEDRLCACLPLCGVVPLESSALATMDGPNNIGDVLSFGDKISATSISTYPLMTGSTARQGDPVCDRFKAEVHSNGAVLALADGCNWGRLPYDAACKATEAFVSFMAQHVGQITTIRGAGPFLLAALTRAHNAIVEGNDTWDSGTTTLIGGLLMQLAGEERWVFVCVSLGDCKAFHFSQKTRTFTDITQGNRRNLTDARDPGGRLGPYVGIGQPDLRNLRMYHQFADPGDLIFLVSDGVHDNLDPQQLGTTPSEAGIGSGTWEEAEKLSPAAVETYKTDFRKRWLQDAFVNGTAASTNNNTNNNSTSNISPQQIIDVLLSHCVETTRSSREWMEQHPHNRLPHDYRRYPGKMDHASCLCCRVGPMTTTPLHNITVTSHILTDPHVDNSNNNNTNNDTTTATEQIASLSLKDAPC